jgi:hypothetical protein
VRRTSGIESASARRAEVPLDSMCSGDSMAQTVEDRVEEEEATMRTQPTEKEQRQRRLRANSTT